MSPDPSVPLLAALRAEAGALDLLAYRHQVCLLLVAAGDLGHVAPALDDLQQAEEELAAVGLRRAVAAADAAGAWGLPAGATLAQLAAAAPGPGTGDTLRAEREELRTRVEEIAEQRQVIQRLSAALLPVLAERQDRLFATFEASTYGPGPGPAAA